ncbi:YheC/YheD family protein [Paenibacillus sp. y28]|uniref:YheC/YheD family protein n=1 Tax=Paenibacillus sp. y28 TaxID=3129110 RepID=UPI00301A268A
MSKITRLTSKLKKTKILEKHPLIRKHIPATAKMTSASLKAMLAKYSMVYVKPVCGTHGIGVMRVEQLHGGPFRYRYQSGTKVRRFTDFAKLYQSLKSMTRGKAYLVQKGIHLLKHGGRPFDIRVMVQRNPKGVWEHTAMIGRVAHPKKIVTNFHNGGRLLSVPALLSSHVRAARKKTPIRRMGLLGLQVARKLGSRYPGMMEIGVDVALDARLKPWVLEVNTKPDPYIFRALRDKSVFRKVVRYAKAYGKFKKRRRS